MLSWRDVAKRIDALAAWWRIFLKNLPPQNALEKGARAKIFRSTTLHC